MPAMPITGDDDLVTLMVKIASNAHDRGDLTDDQLAEALKLATNARAAENGYAERFGMPFSDKAPRRRGPR